MSLLQTSRTRIACLEGLNREAVIGDFDTPLPIGLNGSSREYFAKELERAIDEPPAPSSMDHLVLAVGSCLTAILGVVLERHGIPTQGRLESVAEGDLEVQSGGIRLARMRMRYRLPYAEEEERIVQNALRSHVVLSPTWKSVEGRFDLECSIERSAQPLASGLSQKIS